MVKKTKSCLTSTCLAAQLALAVATAIGFSAAAKADDNDIFSPDAAPAVRPEEPAPSTAPEPAPNAGDKAAAKSGDAPSLAEWKAVADHEATSFPHRMIFVTKVPKEGAATILDFDGAEFNRGAFFQVVDAATYRWNLKLNPAASGGAKPFNALINLTGADTVVLARPKGDWKFYRLKDGKRKQVWSAKPPSGRTASDILDWLPGALGWDGVVLAQRDNYLLVGATAERLGKEQAQALAVSSSSGKFALKSAERKGAGLLSLSQSEHGLAVFDIVFLGQGVSRLPPGTKLIIERKEKAP